MSCSELLAVLLRADELANADAVSAVTHSTGVYHLNCLQRSSIVIKGKADVKRTLYVT